MRGPIHINRQWLERRITNRLVSLRRIVMAGMLVAGTNAFAAPTVPPYFSAAAVAPRQVNLSWLQSTDPNSAVTSYRIYRNGALLASAPQELYDPRYPDTAQHAFQDQTVAASTTYTYYIVAQNSLNQLSPNSATITVTTPAGSGGLLLPERQIDWSANRAVGVPGGIPTNRSRIIDVSLPPYNADKSGQNDTTAALGAAIAAAQPGDIVYLPTGRYKILNQIYVQKSNLTIRGDGPSLTIINVQSPNTAIYVRGIFGDLSSRVIAGASRGSTQITVEDGTNFSVGQMLQIARLNDRFLPEITPYGYNHLRLQKLLITAKSGNTLTIYPPLFTNYAGDATYVRQTISVAANVGIEDLGIETATTPNGIYLDTAFSSWVKNVVVKGFVNYPLTIADSLQSEVRHSVFSANHNGSSGASINIESSSSLLIEDNIISDCNPEVFMINHGSSGNVVGYNLFKNGRTNSNHAAHNSFNLFEGNFIENYITDGYYGSESEGTLFRNYVSGYLALKRWSRNFTLIGNILSGYSLGQPNMGNPTFTGYAQASRGIYWLDWNPHSGPTILGTLNRSSDSSGTVTLTNANDAVRLNEYISRLCGPISGACTTWLGVDWGQGKDVTKIRMAMTATIDAATKVVSLSGGYPNALPASGTTVGIWPRSEGFQELDLDVGLTTVRKSNYLRSTSRIADNEQLQNGEVLPNSLYRDAKPDWFGTLPWPPIDPSNPVPSVDSLPAGFRYNHPGQETPGVGGGTPARPAAPSNLKLNQ